MRQNVICTVCLQQKLLAFWVIKIAISCLEFCDIPEDSSVTVSDVSQLSCRFQVPVSYPDLATCFSCAGLTLRAGSGWIPAAIPWFPATPAEKGLPEWESGRENNFLCKSLLNYLGPTAKNDMKMFYSFAWIHCADGFWIKLEQET